MLSMLLVVFSKIDAAQGRCMICNVQNLVFRVSGDEVEVVVFRRRRHATEMAIDSIMFSQRHTSIYGQILIITA